MTSQLAKEAKKSSFKKSVLMGMIDEKVNELASQIQSVNLESFKSGDIVMKVMFIHMIANATDNIELSNICVEWMEIINA